MTEKQPTHTNREIAELIHSRTYCVEIENVFPQFPVVNSDILN